MKVESRCSRLLFQAFPHPSWPRIYLWALPIGLSMHLDLCPDQTSYLGCPSLTPLPGSNAVFPPAWQGMNALHRLTPGFSGLCPGNLGPCLHPLALRALCGLVSCWIHLWIPRGVHLHLDVGTYSPKACWWSDWAIWGGTATTSVLQKHF